jgi:hypothetical protein
MPSSALLEHQGLRTQLAARRPSRTILRDPGVLYWAKPVVLIDPLPVTLHQRGMVDTGSLERLKSRTVAAAVPCTRNL